MAAPLGSMYIDFIANTAGFSSGMSKAQQIAKAGFGNIEKSADKATHSAERLGTTLSRRNSGAAFALTARQIASVDDRLRALTATANRAESAVSRISRSGSVFVSGAFSALTFTGITNSIRGTLKSLADLDDQAQRIGVSAEGLQAIGDVGKLAGVEVDQLAGAIKKLNLEVGQARISGGVLADIFNANNRSFSNSPLENFRTVAELIANARTEQEKAVIGAAAFGKSYADLIPLLNQGAAAVYRSLKKRHGRSHQRP
jgi:hypothetical protein